MEYIKEAVPIVIPWGEIGYALVPFNTFIQIADIVGIHGITFIVILINSLIYYALRLTEKNRPFATHFRNSAGESIANYRKKMIIPVFLIVFLFTLPTVYGKIRLTSLHSDILSKFSEDLAMNADLIQGNFSLTERWSGMGFYNRLGKYLEMTGAGQDKKKVKRIIVWPETTLNATTKLDDNLFMQIMKYIGEDALLISGGLKEDEKTGSILNSAYLISGQGHLMRYDKHILLPYAETSPLIDLLDRYYTAPSQFMPGSTPLSFQTPNGNIGVSICFETLYPKLIRQSVRNGAEVLVNISNDAWFGKSPMPYTHLNAARLRAIENRRYLLRTSNSGISAIIAPDGNIICRTHLFMCEQISGEFLRLDKISVYSKFGDIILYLSALFLCVAFFQIIVKN